jgi:osmoprotectant transport system substrate-binding protein
VKRIHGWTGLAVVAALALGACGSDGDSSGSDDTSTAGSVSSGPLTVTVSSGNFAESELLGEIYAQAMENAGIRVARKDPIGAREAYYAAIKAGEVSLIPEYTNSLLSFAQRTEGVTATVPSTVGPVDTAATSDTTATSGTEDSTATSDTGTASSAPAAANGPTIEDQVAMIQQVLPDNLTVGQPSTAEDKDVIVCSSAIAEQYSLTNLSDLAAVADQITLGAPPEFEDRTPFGLVGFKDIYGAEFKEFVPLEIGVIADSIKSGAIDCGNLFSTMSVILTEGLLPLEDDKTMVAHEAVLPLLTTEAATPEVLAALDAVSASLTTDVLKSLMVKIEVDKLSADVVAKEFLGSLSSGG